MPAVGEAKVGQELGYKTRGEYIWHACINCGKERWVKIVKVQPQFERCHKCGHSKFTTENTQWKGGRIKTSNGYIYIKLHPNDPYLAMANNARYVAEHRLVVAKALNRCLLPWEIVHHKGAKYPQGSIENKQDNRYPENLGLTTQNNHHIDAIRLVREEEQKRILEYLKSLLEVNPKASLASTIDLIETTNLES